MTPTAKKTAARKPRFDYKTIKTFEDACKKLNVDPAKLPEASGILEEFAKPIIAAYKLMIIYKAINNGWKPDWSKPAQWKYYPWYGVLSSGFSFSASDYSDDCPIMYVGSRLCTDSSEKALYIAGQFRAEYQEYFLYSE